MEDKTKMDLTSSEMSILWKTYIFETLNRCILKHFIATVEDNEIATIIKDKLNTKEQRIRTLTEIFKKENFPVPIGFTDHDINVSAPRLFTDAFMAHYIYYMATMAIDNYRIGVTVSPRADIRQFFISGINTFIQFTDRIMDCLLQKGLFARSPYVPYPKQIDFVQETSFIHDIFGKKRPLQTIQISHVCLNLQRNAIGQQLLIAFKQTAKSEEVKAYMDEGIKLSSSLMETFNTLLKEDDLIPPSYSGLGVTDSTEAPFSEKLMLSLITSLNAYAISLYGLSLSESARDDLFAWYTKILAQTGEYGMDGAKLMIKNGYLEEPPKAPNRESLAKA
ncbi:DUF3231 family protein [Paenibacillus cremeus]|nr:DUF3231 family protein [Paenibacillus cremeus]